MKITKFGHCCLLIEEAGLRILTDPGSFTTEQDSVKDIDLVLITHEHQDHFHVASVKKILANNPHAEVITNSTVGKLLDAERINYRIIANAQHTNVKGVLIEGFGTTHAIVHPEIPVVENTGYFIAGKLFYPGDALTIPPKKVDCLALPTAGPWIKSSESIEYARAIKPRICFPVHDAVVMPSMHALMARLAQNLLNPRGITYHPLAAGETFDV